jgi:hypothetical protein
MKRVEKLEIDSKKRRSIESGAYRQALIELGMYSVPTHKVHKNKKAYNRKHKQQAKWQDIV